MASKEQILRTRFKNRNKDQLFMLELKRYYNLRHPKGDEPTMVFFVVSINGTQIKISTGLKLYPKHWQKGRATESTSLPEQDATNNRLLCVCLFETDHLKQSVHSFGKAHPYCF